MQKISDALKILLVEDDRTMRQIEIRTLNNIGYKDILQAANGNEAIQIFHKKPGIDIVISDWNMPGMGGLELLLWIRSNDKFKNIPFIMATGQADKIHQKKALDAGATGFIVKPFSDNELQSAINNAFGVKEKETRKTDNLPRHSSSGKVLLKIAHIQITDHLVMGVLKYLMDKGELEAKYFDLKLICMPGWNQVAESLEKGLVDGACILLPLAMDLYSIGTAIKLVLLSHKNGSMFVRTTRTGYEPPFTDFFKNCSFMIPHKMSVHHMLAHLFLSRIGLHPAMNKGDQYDVEFEVVPPVNMPEFLTNDTKQSGFMVAEPIGSQAVESGIAECQFLSGEMWENHPCCSVVMQKSFIDNYSNVMYELTQLLVKSGKFITANPDIAAQIAVEFLDPDKTLGLTTPLLKKVLTDPMGITTNDLYPVMSDLETMQNYMVQQMGIGTNVNLKEFVDLRFADNACNSALFDYRPSILHSSKEEISDILNRSFERNGNGQEKNLNVETEKKRLRPQYSKEEAQETKLTPSKNAIPENNYDTSSTASSDNNRIISHDMIETEPVIAEEGKYLSFFLAAEEYAVSIKNVREIIGMMAITHVPRTPDYVKGVINLRGKVIPVMDLRIKFGMKPVEYTDRTCILVVEIPSEQSGHYAQIGVVVDSVSEVLNIRTEDIEENPKFVSSLDTAAIPGMAKIDDRVRILLDIDKALSERS